MDALAGRVVLPPVIRAGELAALDLPARELELAVRAAVLDGGELAVLAAEQRDRLLPERRLDDLAALDLLIPFERIPIIGIHPRRARLLPPVLRLFEGRRSGRTKIHELHGFFHRT